MTVARFQLVSGRGDVKMQAGFFRMMTQKKADIFHCDCAKDHEKHDSSLKPPPVMQASPKKQ